MHQIACFAPPLLITNKHMKPNNKKKKINKYLKYKDKLIYLLLCNIISIHIIKNHTKRL